MQLKLSNDQVKIMLGSMKFYVKFTAATAIDTKGSEGKGPLKQRTTIRKMPVISLHLSITSLM